MSPPPHLKRHEGHNHARFLTCSCFGRKPLLSRERTSRWLVDAIETSRDKHGFGLLAWVIMPEHFHLLIFPPAIGPDVGSILASIKLSVARRAVNWLKANAPEKLVLLADERPDGSVVHRFWMRGGGYDRNLWTPEHIWEKIQYIHKNPVRRGLCDQPEEWLWSSARTYRDRTMGLLKIDVRSIPVLTQS